SDRWRLVKMMTVMSAHLTRTRNAMVWGGLEGAQASSNPPRPNASHHPSLVSTVVWVVVEKAALSAVRAGAGRRSGLLLALPRRDDLRVIHLFASMQIRGCEVPPLDLARVEDRRVGRHRRVRREVRFVGEHIEQVGRGGIVEVERRRAREQV